jgi:hypothetical protein
VGEGEECCLLHLLLKMLCGRGQKSSTVGMHLLSACVRRPRSSSLVYPEIIKSLCLFVSLYCECHGEIGFWGRRQRAATSR